MTAEELIDWLAADLTPVKPRAARRRIGLALLVGILVAIVLLSLTLGLRPDLDIAMAGMMFWVKLCYSASLALVAVLAAGVLARPEASPPRWLWLIGVPVGALGAYAIVELTGAPAGHRTAMWLGKTWMVCPAIVVMLSAPIMAALAIAFRGFAPTRLRLTGAVIGLGAGAAAAAVYCLHCPEATASFVLTWYTLGIAGSVALGAAALPRVLRW